MPSVAVNVSQRHSMPSLQDSGFDAPYYPTYAQGVLSLPMATVSTAVPSDQLAFSVQGVPGQQVRRRCDSKKNVHCYEVGVSFSWELTAFSSSSAQAIADDPPARPPVPSTLRSPQSTPLWTCTTGESSSSHKCRRRRRGRSLQATCTTKTYTLSITVLSSVTLVANPAGNCTGAACPIASVSLAQPSCLTAYTTLVSRSDGNGPYSCSPGSRYLDPTLPLQPITVTVRLANDPYLKAAQITDCELNFGLTAAEWRRIAIILLVIGCVWTVGAAVIGALLWVLCCKKCIERQEQQRAQAVAAAAMMGPQQGNFMLAPGVMQQPVVGVPARARTAASKPWPPGL